MEYCVVAGNYPTKERQVHVFLENVVLRLVDRGHKVNVVAPQSAYTYFLKKDIKRDVVSKRKTSSGNEYVVYSPIYFVFPKFKIGKYSLHNLSRKMFYNSLKKTYKKYGFTADVFYAHFIQAGIAAVKLATELNVPSFIANGEADTIDSLKYNTKKSVQETLENVTGIISVSTKNKNEIQKISNNDINIMSKLEVIVNAVDSERFYPKNKQMLRNKFGWKQDSFIVSFTGSFIERKGITKLSNVLQRFNDVYSIFMGVVDQKPNCKNILYCGRVNNKEMVDYLNASDVFVLPTLAEGCSNAIVEAVSCGLPVISSDLEFNYDILDSTNSILIDPMSEDEIYKAISLLKENANLRNRLNAGAIQKAKDLTLDARVDKIENFILDRM